MRWVSTRVLPDPAPATMSSGPPSWTTASRCGPFRPASMRSRSRPAEPGTYTITVVVTDGYGGSITDSMQYTVTILTLELSKMSIKLNFSKAGNDGIQAKGLMPVSIFGDPKDFFFLLEGETFDLNVGGV